MSLYVHCLRNMNFFQSWLVMALPRLWDQMVSLLFSIKNIGVLSKMWFFLAFGIFLEIIDSSRNKITLLLFSFPSSWVLLLWTSSVLLVCAISFTRLSQKFWQIDSKLNSIFSFLRINQLLFLPEIFKIIPLWPMSFLMLSIQRRVVVVLWLSRSIWKRLLIVWSGAFF